MSDKKSRVSKDAKKLQRKTQKAVKNIKKAAQSFQDKQSSFMEELLVTNYKEIAKNKKKKP